MKKNLSKTIIWVLATVLLASCATAYRPLSEAPDHASYLGELEVRFETNVRIRTGILGYAGLGMAGAGGATLGVAIFNPSGELFAVGGAMAGIGLGLALLADLQNARMRGRINRSAHEALLIAARREHSGNIDVREITFYPPRQDGQISPYQYTARGIVILLE